MINHIKTIISTIARLYRYGIPSHILSFGQSLGDNLLLTALTTELSNRGYKNIWIKCDHDDLFKGNTNIKLVLPYYTLLSTFILNVLNVQRINTSYTIYNKETDQDLIPEKHIILKMADHLNLKGNISTSPILTLTADEKLKGAFATDHIVVITSGISASFPMKNKEWIADRYQKVINSLSHRYSFIQLGSVNDTPLQNVKDMRGKTSIRESAAILANAVLMLSHVGFMMHLARAVNCRAVIIYGGRETPAQSGYTCFENLYSPVACSPCWLHNKCAYDKKCMDIITSDNVLEAIVHQLQFKSSPLNKDILYND